jgi:thiamine pyrophosphokinase
VKAVVLAGGPLVAHPRLQAAASAAALVIAADGGLAHAVALGCTPQLLVGDLDSVDAATLARYPSLPRQTHPQDKDQLDLELALAAAVAGGASQVLVVGGLAGRLDQTLANLMVLSALHAQGVSAHIDDGVRRAWPLAAGDALTLPLSEGETFSVVPLDAQVRVSVEGAAYPLVDEILARTVGRGVSNRAGSTTVVRVHAGQAWVVAPGDDQALA